MKTAATFTARQLAFKELFVGTLIYAVVLGFFNDYTSFVYAKSFSTIFLAGAVLELLTFCLLWLKGWLFGHFKRLEALSHKGAVLFCIWLVMFLSKFVFMWILDWLFGSNLNISGFIAVAIMVGTVTILSKLFDLIFQRLGSAAEV